MEKTFSLQMKIMISPPPKKKMTVSYRRQFRHIWFWFVLPFIWDSYGYNMYIESYQNHLCWIIWESYEHSYMNNIKRVIIYTYEDHVICCIWFTYDAFFLRSHLKQYMHDSHMIHICGLYVAGLHVYKLNVKTSDLQATYV